MLDTAGMASALSNRLASSGACSRQQGVALRSGATKPLLQAAKQRSPGRTQPVRAIAEPPTRTVSAPHTQNGAGPSDWAPDSWKQYTAHQQPNYPDKVRANLRPHAGLAHGDWVTGAGSSSAMRGFMRCTSLIRCSCSCTLLPPIAIDTNQDRSAADVLDAPVYTFAWCTVCCCSFGTL